jgi:hypothetical protein
MLRSKSGKKLANAATSKLGHSDMTFLATTGNIEDESKRFIQTMQLSKKIFFDKTTNNSFKGQIGGLSGINSSKSRTIINSTTNRHQSLNIDTFSDLSGKSLERINQIVPTRMTQNTKAVKPKAVIKSVGTTKNKAVAEK